MEWMARVAFITGGAQGIGLGIGRALAKRGVRLAVVDIDDEALARCRTELTSLTDIETFHLDVRDREAFLSVADEAETRLGPVKLLFNNAGIAPYAPAARLDYDKWDLALGVNVGGVVNGIQTFVPRMIDRGEGGYVVNTASGAGVVSGPNVLYTTTKYAVVGMSESLRLSAAKHGIDVSVLCPAFVNTEILKHTETIGGIDHSVLQTSDRRQETETSLQAGLSIDEVGDMVLAGMETRAMWIFTDDSIRPYVQHRADAMLDAFPKLSADAAP